MCLGVMSVSLVRSEKWARRRLALALPLVTIAGHVRRIALRADTSGGPRQGPIRSHTCSLADSSTLRPAIAGALPTPDKKRIVGSVEPWIAVSMHLTQVPEERTSYDSASASNIWNDVRVGFLR
jgi:hypothetical protein